MATGTQIDQLVVSLGLDPTKFTQGQQQAVAAFKQLQQQAAKNAKGFEESAQKIMNFMSRIRAQAIGFATAAFGAHGISEFVQKITTSNAALDRTAQMLGVSARSLATWRGAAELAGGSAEGMQNAIVAMMNDIQNFAVTGQTQFIPWLQSLGVQAADAEKKMKPFQQLFLEIADAMKGKTPTERMVIGRAFGWDEATIVMLGKGREAVQGLLDEMERLNKITDDTVKRSSELQKEWRGMALAATNLGNTLFEEATPTLSIMLRTIKNSLEDVGALWSRIFGGGSPIRTTAPATVSELRSGQKAGSATASVAALAAQLQNTVPGFNRFTSFDDDFHKGTGSAHEKGLAMDFTIKGGKADAAATAASIRKWLQERGIGARLDDEYNFPSKKATAGHFHVEFNSKEAADRFLSSSGPPGAGGARAGGTVHNETNVTIGSVNATLTSGSADDLAAGIVANIKQRAFAGNAQGY